MGPKLTCDETTFSGGGGWPQSELSPVRTRGWLITNPPNGMYPVHLLGWATSTSEKRGLLRVVDITAPVWLRRSGSELQRRRFDTDSRRPAWLRIHLGGTRRVLHLVLIGRGAPNEQVEDEASSPHAGTSVWGSRI